MAALVIRHFVGHLFHQRLIIVTLTGSECLPTHMSSGEGLIAGFGLAESRVEYFSFSIYLFSIMFLCYLDVV